MQRESPDSDEYVSVGEGAAAVGVSPKTVYDWIRSGRVRALRSPGGGRIRVLRADLDWRPAAADRPAS